MKIRSFFLITTLITVSGADVLGKNSLSSEDVQYLGHSLQVATPMGVLPNDELIRFEADITGDNRPEVFYTRSSYRDGKQGNIWSLYERTAAGALHLLGEVTFSEEVFAPRTWSKDDSLHGFYTFGTAGGGEGTLYFHAIKDGRLEKIASRNVQPNGTDREEFTALFGDTHEGGRSAVAVKRKTLPSQYVAPYIEGTPNSAIPPIAQPPPPGSSRSSGSGAQVQRPMPQRTSEAQVPATQASVAARTETASPILWGAGAVTAVAALGLAWLLLKKRK